MATNEVLEQAQASIDTMNRHAEALAKALPLLKVIATAIAVALVFGIAIMAGGAAISGITTGGILSKILWWILLLATLAGSGSAAWWTWQQMSSADPATDKTLENK